MDGNGLYMCNGCQYYGSFSQSPIPLGKNHQLRLWILPWDDHDRSRHSPEDWKSWELDKGNHPLLWPQDSEDSGEREVL